MSKAPLHDPTSAARKSSDITVLIFTIIIVLIFITFLSLGNLSIFGLVIFSLVLALIYIRLFQISLMGNAMRVQNGKHAYLKVTMDELSKSLNLPPIDVYVTQNPVLNAFAIGYTRPFSIVLNSAMVERLNENEMKAILLHELGHIKYHHTIITAYITPLSTVPIFGQIVTWIFGFWSRRAEMACDRLATAYFGTPQPMASALIKVHVGADIGDFMPEEAVIYQDMVGRGLSRKVSQSLQSHPFLVTRVWEIIDFAIKHNLPLPANVTAYLQDRETGSR